MIIQCCMDNFVKESHTMNLNEYNSPSKFYPRKAAFHINANYNGRVERWFSFNRSDLQKLQKLLSTPPNKNSPTLEWIHYCGEKKKCIEHLMNQESLSHSSLQAVQSLCETCPVVQLAVLCTRKFWEWGVIIISDITDYDNARVAVRRDPRALQFVSQKLLKQHPNIISEAVEKDISSALYNLDTRLKRNPGVLCAIVEGMKATMKATPLDLQLLDCLLAGFAKWADLKSMDANFWFELMVLYPQLMRVNTMSRAEIYRINMGENSTQDPRIPMYQIENDLATRLLNYAKECTDTEKGNLMLAELRKNCGGFMARIGDDTLPPTTKKRRLT